MKSLYERSTRKLTVGESIPMPAATYGQISLNRLIEMMERDGEVRPTERITHLIICNDVIQYCTERRKDG